jgi:amino acid transporter
LDETLDTRKPEFVVESAAVADITDDVRVLHRLGYAQELRRGMNVFSNFAISFSIICILAGGITSFQLGFGAVGGAAIGIGWPLAAGFAMIVAASMAQIASAYPTAGGLYHWASILGGRGWGWVTAWLNLVGLIFVVASVNVGVWQLALNLLGPLVGIDPSKFGVPAQIVAVLLITATQAVFNHVGIKVTSRLTDFSGYLIFAVAALLTIALLANAHSLDFGRLFAFSNFTGSNFPGDAANVVWPVKVSTLLAFGLSLLLPAYTITGFDASAHTSEETVHAQSAVPKGMLNAVFWSGLCGYVMVCAFVLAMPNVIDGAKQGANVFTWIMAGSPMPATLKNFLLVGIVLANYLCGLAGLTSTSRMVFAFSRDGGLPASHFLRHVSHKYRTPAHAVWIAALLAFAVTLYTPAFTTLAAGCAVFLYLSYASPVIAGLFAEGRSWTDFGPFRLGTWSKPFAVVTGIGAIGLLIAGIQPPNDGLVTYCIGFAVALAIGWFAIARKRFPGPPVGKRIEQIQAELVAEERAMLVPE